MPHNSSWLLCDTVQLFGTSQLKLYKSDDSRYLRFYKSDPFNPVDTISSGTYIAIRLSDNGPWYFAYSQTNDPRNQLYKIYSTGSD